MVQSLCGTDAPVPACPATHQLCEYKSMKASDLLNSVHTNPLHLSGIFFFQYSFDPYQAQQLL